jgi:4-hydroxybenzoate polyprenyltransferase
MPALFRLVRFPNLLVVALTQYLLHQWVIAVPVQQSGLSRHLSDFHLWALIAATVMVAAGGYLINDIFDQAIDRYNQDHSRLAYSGVREKTAAWLFFFSISSSFLLSLWLALQLNELSWLWLFPAAAGALYLYSQFVKPSPFAGNLLVAILCAGVAALVLLAERQSLAALQQRAPLLWSKAMTTSAIFMAYAFLVTLAREIVKDLEDMRGDARFQRKTLPIVLGVGPAKRLVILLLALLSILLALPSLQGWAAFSGYGLRAYTFLLLGITFVCGWMLLRATSEEEYFYVSSMLKGLIAAGLGFLYLTD